MYTIELPNCIKSRNDRHVESMCIGENYYLENLDITQAVTNSTLLYLSNVKSTLRPVT